MWLFNAPGLQFTIFYLGYIASRSCFIMTGFKIGCIASGVKRQIKQALTKQSILKLLVYSAQCTKGKVWIKTLNC